MAPGLDAFDKIEADFLKSSANDSSHAQMQDALVQKIRTTQRHTSTMPEPVASKLQLELKKKMADVVLASLRAPCQEPAALKSANPRVVTSVTNTDSRPQSATKAPGAHENSTEEDSETGTAIVLIDSMKADALAAQKSATANMLKSVNTETQSLLGGSGDDDSSVSPLTYKEEVGYAAGVQCRQWHMLAPLTYIAEVGYAADVQRRQEHLLTPSAHQTDLGHGAEEKDVGEQVAKKERAASRRRT